MIWTDRSRMETFEKCPAKRFWQYEYAGRGLERVNDLMLDARIGTWVHSGIELWLGAIPSSRDAKAAAEWASASFQVDCEKVGTSEVSQQLAFDITEGAQIVIALVYAWLRLKGPRVVTDGDILALEKELVTFLGDGVMLMSRPDIIWRRKSDGTVFIRNLKTVRDPSKWGWMEKWALDMQTLSEPLAVDAWLRDEYYHCERLEPRAGEPPCGGVVIDGLVTGRMAKNKETGLYYHDNRLIYAWYQGETDTYYPRFEWTCNEPHKFANGRSCEGGRNHKLSGARRVSIAESYPGGIIAWIDYLIENDVSVVEEMLIELPPILRSEWHMERWRETVIPREIEIKARRESVEAGISINTQFPMHTANGNCLMPGKCPMYECCWGSAADDPIGSGLFQFRIPNHPVESGNVNKDK